MPKQKTHKAVAKRFKVTARRKVLYRRAGSRHLLSTKTAKRRRKLGQWSKPDGDFTTDKVLKGLNL